jgi:predicted phosphodiesterase
MFPIFFSTLLSPALSSFFVISDIHYDIAFKADYNSTYFCHEVGYYGSNLIPEPTSDIESFIRPYCDSSFSLIDSALKQMSKIDPDPEFILLTGDLIAHYTSALLQQDGKYNPIYNSLLIKQSLQDISSLFLLYFPNTQIIPMIGNNDAYEDYEIPTGFDKSEYFDFLYTVWNPLAKNIPRTFFIDGYFNMKTSSGFNVIALNSDYFSVYYDDPEIQAEAQLIWLRSQLRSHEDNIIAMHIPPGLGLFGGGKMSWIQKLSDQMVDIIEEFSEKVVAVIAGHYHNGAFQIVGKTQMLLNPSISPYFGNNPGFRYYTTDLDDYAQYNIDGYNITGEWNSFTYSSRYGYKINDTRLYNDLKTDTIDLWYFLKGITGLWIDPESSDELACIIIFGPKACNQGKEYVKHILLCQIINQKLEQFESCISGYVDSR